MQQTELLQYLYAKLKANPDERNQVCFAKSDYEKIKGDTANDIDIIEINKVLTQLQNEGYIQCPRLKDLHIYAAWITITEKTTKFIKNKKGGI